MPLSSYILRLLRISYQIIFILYFYLPVILFFTFMYNELLAVLHFQFLIIWDLSIKTYRAISKILNPICKIGVVTGCGGGRRGTAFPHTVSTNRLAQPCMQLTLSSSPQLQWWFFFIKIHIEFGNTCPFAEKVACTDLIYKQSRPESIIALDSFNFNLTDTGRDFLKFSVGSNFYL